ncbi:MAG: hypothetical protein QW812_00935 [Thermoplasmataceae archaeon]
MTVESDIEMIKSALIYGDIEDAHRFIASALENARVRLRYRPSERVSAYRAFLQQLDSVLSGKTSVEGFRSYLDGSRAMGLLYRMPDQDRQLMESFLYLLSISIDRYNVRYPSFDMKRCDDL